GVENQSSTSFAVYPNPVTESLRINLGTTVKEASYQIVNQLGALVATGNITDSTKNLDVHDLSAGIYIIRVKNAGETASMRFVKN
ncbi:MAG: hypothetical protein RLZZ543_908, partial [Bacteroidota bacterium]